MQAQLDVLQACILRRFNSLLSDDAKADVLEILFFVQSDIRFNQVAADVQVKEVWEHIRSNEVQTDFILGLTQEFHFLAGDVEWNDMVARLAKAVTLSYEASIDLDEPVGAELLERMGSNDFLFAQMLNYPWLAMLVLLEYVDLDKALGGARPEATGE
ncbi:hypothetical protein D3C81_1261660 [compost metagenome]